jgi:hypothetical protein
MYLHFASLRPVLFRTNVSSKSPAKNFKNFLASFSDRLVMDITKRIWAKQAHLISAKLFEIKL